MPTVDGTPPFAGIPIEEDESIERWRMVAVWANGDSASSVFLSSLGQIQSLIDSYPGRHPVVLLCHPVTRAAYRDLVKQLSRDLQKQLSTP